MAFSWLNDSLVFDWSSQSFRADLIFVVPLALCLGIGILVGHPGAALIMAGGAFTVGFGAKQQIDRSHIVPMVLASCGIAAATFVGMVAGHTHYALVAVAVPAAFLYGMVSMRQPGVAWVGQQCIVFLLVASAYPFSPTAAAVRSALVLAGGALQILTSTLLLRLFTQFRTDLGRVAGHIREENRALRLSVEQAARALLERRPAPSAAPYALRLAVTLGVSTEIYRRFGFSSGYWIPMTALLVLRPSLSDTASRAIARTVGTLAGAMLASFALAHLRPEPPILACLVLLFAWLTYSVTSVNYALFTLCLTAYIVNLLALATLPGALVARRRAISTILGGALALSVRLVVIRLRNKRTAVGNKH